MTMYTQDTLVANARFVDADKWSCMYQRNNKSSGLKNLRCFPFCADVHQSRRFCGRAMKVELTLAQQSSNADGDSRAIGLPSTCNVGSLQVWVEFIPSDNNTVKTNVKPTIDVGTAYSRNDLNKLTRDGVKVTNPLLLGKTLTTSQDTAELEFNQKQRGWHYHFTANKHTSDINHCVRAYVMAPTSLVGSDETDGIDHQSLTCVGVFNSPDFKIFCRRRQRHLMDLAKLPAPLREHIESKSRVAKEEGNLLKQSSLSKKRKGCTDQVCADGNNKKNKTTGLLKLEVIAPKTPDDAASTGSTCRHTPSLGNNSTEPSRRSVSPVNSPTRHTGYNKSLYPRISRSFVAEPQRRMKQTCNQYSNNHEWQQQQASSQYWGVEPRESIGEFRLARPQPHQPTTMDEGVEIVPVGYWNDLPHKFPKYQPGRVTNTTTHDVYKRYTATAKSEQHLQYERYNPNSMQHTTQTNEHQSQSRQQQHVRGYDWETSFVPLLYSVDDLSMLLPSESEVASYVEE